MAWKRRVLYVTCLLVLVAQACSSGVAARSGRASTVTADAGATGAVPVSATDPLGGGPTAVPAPVTEPAWSDVPARVSTLPVQSPRADGVILPALDGPAVVGIAASGFRDTVVFYPAVAGTGRGPHRYIDPGWATIAGLEPAQMDRVVSAAQIDAVPEPAAAPRPVVLLMPGWRSVVALSTSLAEDLASHGYVVLATQTDVAAEWSHPMSTPGDRRKRLALLGRVLDFLQGPVIPALVGPIDLGRVAVGGHSYAGTIAFDASLTDRRIAAIVDLDGSARGAADRPPPTRPTLVLVTVNGGVASDPLLGGLAARSARIVAVGVLNALHLDVTDAAAIPSVLGTSVFSTLVGAVGATGTTDTSTIVCRFLDGTFGTTRRLPSSEELVRNMSSATADPFAAQAPAK